MVYLFQSSYENQPEFVNTLENSFSGGKQIMGKILITWTMETPVRIK